MASLEKTIAQAIARHPTLYGTKNRNAVLNHLFCVLGNGYEWENGELRSVFRYRRMKKDTKEERAASLHRTVEEYDAMTARMTVAAEEPLEYCYPLSEDYNFAKIPDNVKPDWLAGAVEAARWVLSLDPDASYETWQARKNAEDTERRQKESGLAPETFREVNEKTRKMLLELLGDTLEKIGDPPERPKYVAPTNAYSQRIIRDVVAPDLKKRFGIDL